MTIATISTSPGPTKALPQGRYSMRGLLAAEWTKLRSVRSTMWAIGVTIVLGVGLSAIATAETRAHWGHGAGGPGFDATQMSLIGIAFAQLVIGILGVLVMSSEFGTGTIRATFAAAPRRPQVLAAKVIVFGAVAFVVSEVASFLSYFVGQALLTPPAVHTTLASATALRQVVGAGLYLTMIGLLGLGLATIIRYTAGALAAIVGVVLVLPLIVQALPNSLSNSLDRFVPLRIGNAITAAHPVLNSFAPWVGFALLCIYAAAALVIGGALLVSRDA
jgi:ABC-2 type transport system permease protein